MSTPSKESAATRRGLGLPRFLALILFAGALVFALAIVPAVGVAIEKGTWRDVGMASLVASLAVMLGWLGKTIWSGRMIPRWFMFGFFGSILAMSLGPALIGGTWGECVEVGSIGLLVAIVFHHALRDYRPGQLAKPKPATFDEL